MSDNQYLKVYTGNPLTIQLIIQRLEAIGINPIIKNENESGRLAGFGTPIPSFSEVFVHKNEQEQAEKVIKATHLEMEENN